MYAMVDGSPLSNRLRQNPSSPIASSSSSNRWGHQSEASISQREDLALW